MTNDCKGFSLIELAMGLLVVGLLVAGVAQWLKVELVRGKAATTRDHAEIVITAINAFYDENARYPMPANPAWAEGHPLYGREFPGAATSPGPTEVMRGAVPFADLKISMKDTLDGWDNKFTYAVSKVQTVSPMPTAGVITVTALVPVIPPPLPPLDDMVSMNVPGVYWALISHGDRGRGAYTSSGVLIPCPTAAPVPLEQENCDNDNVFYMSGDKTGTTTGQRSVRDGAGYMDDYTYYTDEIFDRAWVNAQSTTGQDNAINNFGILGIKTDTPGVSLVFNPVTGLMELTPDGVDFDVNGTARANVAGPNPADEKGLTHSQEYCDPTGVECFKPLKIGGTGMKECFDNTPADGVTGIGSSKTKCLGMVPPAFMASFDCPGGEFVTGFNATGGPVCAP